MLVVISLARRREGRSRRDHLLAFVSGLFLAADLESPGMSRLHSSGAGLGTVIPNVQIVFVAIVAWLHQGERPRAWTIGMIAVVLFGSHADIGARTKRCIRNRPGEGVALGVAAGLCYAVFLVVLSSLEPIPRSACRFRCSTRRLAPPPARSFRPDWTTSFTFAVSSEAHLWLFTRRDCFAGDRMAVHRDSPPSSAVGRNLRPAPRSTSIRDRLGRDVLRRNGCRRLQWVGSAIVLAGVAGTLDEPRIAKRCEYSDPANEDVEDRMSFACFKAFGYLVRAIVKFFRGLSYFICNFFTNTFFFCLIVKNIRNQGSRNTYFLGDVF
jgi:hypothetical protein